MKKGNLVLLLLGVLFISLIIAVGVDRTKVYHDSTNVSIGIDGTNQTLNNLATGSATYTHTYSNSNSNLITGQHDASKIWVNVKGTEKTLLAALTSGINGLCGSGSYSTYSSSAPNPGHYATEIQLSSGKSLQEEINAGTFCCSASMGNNCYPSGPSQFCVNTQGTLACDGTTCTGTTFKPAGTACHYVAAKCICMYPPSADCLARCGAHYDSTYICDSSGNCNKA